MEYTPIAFFAFNRPYHTYKTLSSLSKNSEAKNTDLYAFIDGHRKISEIHLIDSVDIFVFLDEVQYTRRDWRNRNKIVTPHGAQWLTVPVISKGKYFQKISETKVASDVWKTSH